MQSRYYDPKVGRFLNADALVSTGQGILGNNMFAYCNNNSISGFDPCGTCFHRWDCWNDCELCAGKSAFRRIKEALSGIPGTYSQGITASVSTGIWALGLQFGVSVDVDGDVEYQWSFYGGVSTGSPGASLQLYNTITTAPDVTKLRGMGYNIGVGIAAGAAVTADVVIIPDDENGTTYWGGSAAGGIGGGADVHVLWGDTKPFLNLRFNIYDVLENVFS